MKSKPLITVIVAVYNGEKTLQKCIDSFREQDYEEKELIIIDGKSNDKTLEIIKKNKDDIKFYLSESDAGICDAWNKGLKRASGDWIHFLGADDFFLGNHSLSSIAKILEKIPSDIFVTYGKVLLVNPDGVEISVTGEEWSKARKKIFSYMSIPHQGVFHRHELFEKFGEFNKKFRLAGDYELLLRCLKTSDAYFINKVVAGMTVGGLSSDPKNNKIVWSEYRMALKENKLPSMNIEVFTGLLKIISRSIIVKVFGSKVGSKIIDAVRSLLGKEKYWTRL